jgi:hypothetical protein
VPSRADKAAMIAPPARRCLAGALLAAFVALAGGCAPEEPPQPPAPPRPCFVAVREVRAAVEGVAAAALERAQAAGVRPIWRARLASNLEALERVAASLEAGGGDYGAARIGEAEELLRIGFDLRQTGDADGELGRALAPHVLELTRISQRLRTFLEP